MKDAELSIVFDTFSSESVIKVASKSGHEIHMAFPKIKEMDKWFQILNLHKTHNNLPITNRLKSMKPFMIGMKEGSKRSTEAKEAANISEHS